MSIGRVPWGKRVPLRKADLRGQTPCGTAVTSSSGAKRCGACHAPKREAAPAGDRYAPHPAPSYHPVHTTRLSCLPVPEPQCPDGSPAGAASHVGDHPTLNREKARAGRVASGCCLPHSGAGAEYETDGPQQSQPGPDPARRACPHSSRAGGGPPEHGGRKLGRLFHRRSHLLALTASAGA